MERTRGFSLLELIVAVSILAIVALGLVALVASSRQLSAQTRERAVAQAALRAYVENLRSMDLNSALTDTGTPADFIQTGITLGSPKTSPKGEVWKAVSEDGTQAWYLSYSQSASPTGRTTTSVTTGFTGTSSALGRSSSGWDMNANKATTDVFTDGTSLIFLPVYAKLSWASILGLRGGGSSSTGEVFQGLNASMDIYVCIGQP
jgi:prepilin-type N-terminal cleavage/methylation domain-containing protein